MNRGHLRAILFAGCIGPLILGMQSTDKPSLQLAAVPNDVLVRFARAQPDSAREAIARAFAVAASTQSDRQLPEARQLASAYAAAWKDSFHVRQVERFAKLSSTHRRTRVRSDSLRRAGNDALVTEGVPVAMNLWRESLQQAAALNDSASIGPALLSIGAGFYRSAEFDSATRYLNRARLIALRIGDVRTEGNALGILASVRKDQGRLDEAAATYRRAAELRARSGDSRGIAADENNLATIAEERGDLRDAAASYSRALAINRREKRPTQAALNLSNLAGIATTEGEYSRAETLYREALTLHARVKNFAEIAFLRHDIGNLFVHRGDYRRAEAELRESIRLHEESGAAMEAIGVRADLASVLSAIGNPEAASAVLEDAARLASKAGATASEQAALALANGDLAMRFGTFSDADAEYAKAVKFSRSAKDSSGLARAIEGQALLLHWRGYDVASLELLDEAMRLHSVSADRRSIALVALIKAEILTNQGNFALSRRTLITSRAELRSLGDVVGEAAATTGLADLALAEGSVKAAVDLYRSGLRRLGTRRAAEVRWRLHTGHADALRRQGSLADAAAELRRAIRVTEESAATLRHAQRRSGFLADKWSAYDRLALIETARGRSADAFAVSEQMRARQMLDMLSMGRVTRVTRASAYEQDLRRRITTLTQRLEINDPHLSVSRDRSSRLRSAEATRSDLNQAQKEYARLLLAMRETDARYADLVAPTMKSWESVASDLKPGEVFLEYLLTDSATLVFVITPETVAAIDLRISRQKVADLVEFSRKAMSRPPAGKGEELWRASLRRLYLSLLQPVEEAGHLRGKTRLIIAPHAELHYLSFASLIPDRSRKQFLIDRFQVTYTPSATVWVELAQRRTRTQPAGVLALAPNVSRLPGSRREAAAIGRIHGRNSLVKLGASASPQALRAALPRAGIVHLATFGVLNRHNPLFSYIELAPAGTDDGRLEVNEVFGLSFSGQLVVLSACETGLGSGALADVPPGDDWVGLVQAFLHAGAGTVVGSLWPVEDRATSELMEAFHRRLASGDSPVAALADAQRSLIRNPRTAAPRYWAGFVANGRPE